MDLNCIKKKCAAQGSNSILVTADGPSPKDFLQKEEMFPRRCFTILTCEQSAWGESPRFALQGRPPCSTSVVGETQDVVAVSRFPITMAKETEPWFGTLHTQNVSKRVLD